MLYEIRHYDIRPDQWGPYLSWLEEKASPILSEQFKFRLIGFWRGIAKTGQPEPSRNLSWLLA